MPVVTPSRSEVTGTAKIRILSSDSGSSTVSVRVELVACAFLINEFVARCPTADWFSLSDVAWMIESWSMIWTSRMSFLEVEPLLNSDSSCPSDWDNCRLEASSSPVLSNSFPTL